jgi:DNA-binding NarL/FixJ family response regulator
VGSKPNGLRKAATHRSGEELTSSPGGQADTRRRVLVADDQSRMLEVVAALLRQSFDVIGLISDGQAAVEATLKLEPDLVVLDISMPGMNGIEVARELRKRANKAKIVFLTMHQDAQILANCLATGGLGYVVKELMASDLIPAMNEALAGHVFVSRFSSE